MIKKGHLEWGIKTESKVQRESRGFLITEMSTEGKGSLLETVP